MYKFLIIGVAAGTFCAAGAAAFAQSPEYMTEDCRLASQQFYKEFEARTEAKYEGQRTDGTHAVNGTIYLENRSTSFSCSYNAKGDALVEFFADDKYWPDFVSGKGSPVDSGGGTSPTVDVGGTIVPKAALDSCISDAASAMSVAAQDIKVIKVGQEGADNFYIEVASAKKHLVCEVNSKGEIFNTRYGKL
jgi:hypothetical protein